jgi:hypothetical protein
MDPYDGIIEQLKQARQNGFESLAGRLDSVKAKLDGLVQEVRSALDDAVPQDPDELLSIAEAEAALAEASQRSRESEEQSRQRIAALETGSGGGAAAPAGGLLSLDLLRRLDGARSQSELLREMLTVMSSMSERAAVLVVREGAISAWSGIGFADAEQLRQWRGAITGSSMLQQFVTDLAPVRFAPGSDPLFSAWLSPDEVPDLAMLIPVCLRGKLVGAIYLDPGSAEGFDEEQAQIMVALICWLIDTLATRQERPTPMLGEPTGLPPRRAAAPQPAGEPAAFEPDPVEPAAPAQTPHEEAAPAAPAMPEDFDPSATIRVDMAQMASMTHATEPEPAAPASAPEPQAAAPVEGDGRHEEARRFARLLVSEIKLYNEEEVDRGRANGDLYHRLKEDIDRSREMYEKRIPPEVRSSADYFKEELIRILADGDASVLGM